MGQLPISRSRTKRLLPSVAAPVRTPQHTGVAELTRADQMQRSADQGVRQCSVGCNGDFLARLLASFLVQANAAAYAAARRASVCGRTFLPSLSGLMGNKLPGSPDRLTIRPVWAGFNRVDFALGTWEHVTSTAKTPSTPFLCHVEIITKYDPIRSASNFAVSVPPYLGAAGCQWLTADLSTLWRPGDNRTAGT